MGEHVFLHLSFVLCVFGDFYFALKAAGIQDWRGPDGVWTKKEFDKGKGKAGSGNDEKEDDEGDGGGDEEEGSKSTSSSSVDYNAFRPTLTHEAIAHLLELGYVKHVISQNVDGLHLLSGIPLENLSELHGNAFVEQCPVNNLLHSIY